MAISKKTVPKGESLERILDIIYKDINEIVDFCNKNNLKLLEDSAKSLGCRINKK